MYNHKLLFTDCSLKSLELFVATGYESYAPSIDQHEFWIRANGKNHYYILPVPPGVGQHISWDLEISQFKPSVNECIKEEEIEEIFIKERSDDGWVIQVVTIHYVNWCEEKNLGPDFHHFHRTVDKDGDGPSSSTILMLFP